MGVCLYVTGGKRAVIWVCVCVYVTGDLKNKH